MAIRKKLGEILVEQGATSQEMVKRALGHQRQWGGKVGRILAEMKAVSEEQLARALATQSRMPLAKMKADIPAEVAALLPIELAQENQAIAFGLRTVDRVETVYVAIADPYNVPGMDAIRFRVGKPIKFALAPADEIENALKRQAGGFDEFSPIEVSGTELPGFSAPEPAPPEPAPPPPDTVTLDDLFGPPPTPRAAPSSDLDDLLGLGPPPPPKPSAASSLLDDLLSGPATPPPSPAVAKPAVKVVKFPPKKPTAPPPPPQPEPASWASDLELADIETQAPVGAAALDLSSPADAVSGLGSGMASIAAVELPPEETLQLESSADAVTALSSALATPEPMAELELSEADALPGLELTADDMETPPIELPADDAVVELDASSIELGMAQVATPDDAVAAAPAAPGEPDDASPFGKPFDFGAEDASDQGELQVADIAVASPAAADVGTGDLPLDVGSVDGLAAGVDSDTEPDAAPADALPLDAETTAPAVENPPPSVPAEWGLDLGDPAVAAPQPPPSAEAGDDLPIDLDGKPCDADEPAAEMPVESLLAAPRSGPPPMPLPDDPLDIIDVSDAPEESSVVVDLETLGAPAPGLEAVTETENEPEAPRTEAAAVEGSGAAGDADGLGIESFAPSSPEAEEVTDISDVTDVTDVTEDAVAVEDVADVAVELQAGLAGAEEISDALLGDGWSDLPFHRTEEGDEAESAASKPEPAATIAPAIAENDAEAEEIHDVTEDAVTVIESPEPEIEDDGLPEPTFEETAVAEADVAESQGIGLEVAPPALAAPVIPEPAMGDGDIADSLAGPAEPAPAIPEQAFAAEDLAAPQLADPAVSEAELAEPPVAEPEVAHDAAADAEIAEPAFAGMNEAEPRVDEPEVEHAAVAELEIAGSAFAEVNEAEPQVAELEVAHDAVAEPEAGEPAVSESSAAEPLDSLPAAAEPGLGEGLVAESASLAIEAPDFAPSDAAEPVPVSAPEPEGMDPEFAGPVHVDVVAEVEPDSATSGIDGEAPGTAASAPADSSLLEGESLDGFMAEAEGDFATSSGLDAVAGALPSGGDDVDALASADALFTELGSVEPAAEPALSVDTAAVDQPSLAPGAREAAEVEGTDSTAQHTAAPEPSEAVASEPVPEGAALETGTSEELAPLADTGSKALAAPESFESARSDESTDTASDAALPQANPEQSDEHASAAEHDDDVAAALAAVEGWDPASSAATSSGNGDSSEVLAGAAEWFDGQADANPDADQAGHEGPAGQSTGEAAMAVGAQAAEDAGPEPDAGASALGAGAIETADALQPGAAPLDLNGWDQPRAPIPDIENVLPDPDAIDFGAWDPVPSETSAAAGAPVDEAAPPAEQSWAGDTSLEPATPVEDVPPADQGWQGGDASLEAGAHVDENVTPSPDYYDPNAAALFAGLSALADGAPLGPDMIGATSERLGQVLVKLLVRKGVISTDDVIEMLAIPADKLTSNLVRRLVAVGGLTSDDVVSMVAVPSERLNALILRVLMERGSATADEVLPLLG